MSLFFPTVYRRCITDVTVDDLRRLEAKCVLLDVDNTLAIHDAPELDDAVVAWLDKMRTQFTLVIVSNNTPERVAPMLDGMQIVKELYVPGKLVNIVVKPQ